VLSNVISCVQLTGYSDNDNEPSRAERCVVMAGTQRTATQHARTTSKVFITVVMQLGQRDRSQDEHCTMTDTCFRVGRSA